MIIKVTNVEELKKIFIETLLNKTDKVTKISSGSVLNGFGYGVGKLQQKSLKDLNVIESHLFPDVAYGEYLDEIARRSGISERFGASASSGFIRLVGAVGTTYVAGVNNFSGNGVNFILDENVTIPAIGYCYAKVTSASLGAVTNVDSLSINYVSPIPSGHSYCINEYMITGGRDIEEDDDYRQRIKDNSNELSRGTKSYLEQVFRKINPLVLRVNNQGLDSTGDLVIGVAKINGADFTDSELDELMIKAEKYFSMNELKPDGLQGYGIKIQNIPYFPIDVSVRLDLDSYVAPDEVRKNAQVNLSKFVDFRYWNDGDIIDWIGLINCIKSVNGVKRVLDNQFFPNNDIVVPRGHLPRFRGFMMLNMQGIIIQNFTNTLNPIYYPNNVDFNFQSSVLSDI